jgi:hypothetical protein
MECVARAAAEVDSRYVHMAVMTQACAKMDEVAVKDGKCGNKAHGCVGWQSLLSPLTWQSLLSHISAT